MTKYRHKYPILAQSQSIFMWIKPLWWFDYCTQHEQNPLIHLKYITINIQHLWNNRHKCYFLVAQSQGIFYMHQVLIMIDYCTKYKHNQPILVWDIATNIQFKKNSHKHSNLEQSQMIFYMHQRHMVPNYCTKYE